MTLVGDPSCGEIVIYQTSDGRVGLDARLERETLWLSLNQIAVLFDRDKSIIFRRLRNVFKEGELKREATVAIDATVQTEGNLGKEIADTLDSIPEEALFDE